MFLTKVVKKIKKHILCFLTPSPPPLENRAVSVCTIIRYIMTLHNRVCNTCRRFGSIMFLFSEQKSYLCSGSVCFQSDRNVSSHQTARPHIPKDSCHHDNLTSRMKYDANNLSVFVKFSIRRSLNCRVWHHKWGRNTAVSRIIHSYQTQVSEHWAFIYGKQSLLQAISVSYWTSNPVYRTISWKPLAWEFIIRACV
jgi:hypothetical protein